MVAERNHLARRLQAALQEMESGGTIEIMLHVVLPRPQQLHRRTRALRDRRRLDHVVIAQPAAEATTAAGHVNSNIPDRNAQRRRDHLRPRCRVLRRCPDLNAIALHMRRAVLRLQAGMRQERIGIGRIDYFRRACEGAGRVAIPPQDLRGRLRSRCGRSPSKARTALPGRGTAAPFDLQALPRLVGGPPRIGDDRYAVAQALRVIATVNDERVAHAGLILYDADIGADDLAAEHRTFLEHGVKHARHRHIDAEQWLSGDDLRIVHAALRVADDREVARVLQRYRCEIGRWQGRCLLRQRAIGQRAAAGVVVHHAGRSAARVRRHVPGLRRGAHQQGASGGTDLPHGQPVPRRRHAAACDLAWIIPRVEHRLFDPHILPIHVEFLGDQHRQHGLHALADLRILCGDGHDAVRRDADIGVQRRRSRAVRGGKPVCGQCRAQQQPTAGREADFQEGAAWRDRVHGAPPAACLIAARMRRYVAHRQRLPLMAASMSWSVGCAFCVSRATADMICPAWQ